ncbi:signal peptidase II [soil metagenome]
MANQSDAAERQGLKVETVGTMRGKVGLYAGVVGGVMALDLITKLIAQHTLPPYRPVSVLGDFFRLTYIYNPGAAFGLSFGPASRFIFLALAVIAVVVLFFMYRATPHTDRLRLWSIAAVTGGALGNVVDRFRSPRGVIDFFDFGIGAYLWPVFNVADIAVTIGAILLAISLWREDVEAARSGEAE